MRSSFATTPIKFPRWGAAAVTRKAGERMVKAVGVVGGGIMGSGIAEVAARSGCDVVLREVNEAAVGAPRHASPLLWTRLCATASSQSASAVTHRPGAVHRHIGRPVRSVTWSPRPRSRTRTPRPPFSPPWAEVVRPDALLTSNTSSIPIAKLAAVTPPTRRGHALLQPGDGAAVGRSHSM
jgi:3-hydroxybutyryl-CoA dehydrogenase